MADERIRYMIAFIDTEVSPQTEKVADYGAIREDGAVRRLPLYWQLHP